MNTRHTPGPWEAGSNAVYTHDDRIVAYIPANYGLSERAANAALIAAAPDMTTELARGRAGLCALRHWVPEDLLPTVNDVIVSMAHTIGKATGDCPPEADGRTEKAARAAIEEATK